MRQNRLLIAVLMVAGWANVNGAREADVEMLIGESDPAMQAQIKTAVNLLLSEPLAEAGTTNWQAVRELKKLKELAEEEEHIIEQLAIYVVTEKRGRGQPDLEASAVLHYLDLRPDLVIRVLAPYLGADSARLRAFAGMWFQYHDSDDRTHGRPPLGSVNYYDYKEYVGKRIAADEEIPVAFVKFIYERHPGKALLVFAYGSQYRYLAAQLRAIQKKLEAARQGQELEGQEGKGREFEVRRQRRVKERREIELSERIISNAIWLNENEFPDRFQVALPEATNELAKLAEHDEWWARLYVAYIMRDHPELRQPDIVQQLAEDSDALVSQTANSIRQ